MDKRIEKHARILLDYPVGLKKEDKIAILGEVICYPLMKEVYHRAINLGDYPILNNGGWVK